MSLNALARELQVAWGLKKQSAAATANIAAGMWRLAKENAGFVNPNFGAEDDAAAYGKGHEFATQLYKTAIDVPVFTVEKFLSAEIISWASVFGLGAVTKSGTTPNWIYTCTPQVKTTAGLELPYFSYLEQIRPASGTILDQVFVGCCLEAFQVDVASGPGRGASKISLQMTGTGKITAPSTITMPAATVEKLLPAASLALTIISVDYVTLKDIVKLSWGWKNNISKDGGYYPGSGTQDGYAIAGRLEAGDAVPTLNFTVRAYASSAEYTKLKALTTGTAVITQTYDANNTYTATFQQVGFKVVEMGEDNGKIVFNVTAVPQYHSTNGVLSVVGKCNVDAIGTSE